ncbi:MAG: class I SAM-dependent methyltransferase [Acidobacteriia bacterium]|nr:class I SAM-dependent methyltransferase [Methyloceanibacter sp.]MCL6491470.1 class I SAM-dependent methyltransferase [Terriglobia bacterium]
MQNNVPSPEPQTDFGFRMVPRSAKKTLVRRVFESVAPRYDIMNDLMSLGLHRIWKRILLSALDPRPGRRLLDLAAGTGDVGLGWAAMGGGPVWLTDINAAMLARAKTRAVDRALIGNAHFLVADAEKLPLPDQSFDRVSIAFGLRNCTDKQAVLAEAYRALRSGGRFFCLEFSELQVAAFAPLYEAWSFEVLPLLGKIVAKDAESYRYLAESIRRFPNQKRLAAMMQTAGFRHISVMNLSGGIVALHAGWRV